MKVSSDATASSSARLLVQLITHIRGQIIDVRISVKSFIACIRIWALAWLFRKIYLSVHETNALLKNQRQEQKRSDLDEQLKEYIAEWRKQRAKEEEELKRLKV